VGVGADAGSDDDELAAQQLSDRQVGVLGRQERVLALDDVDLVEVDQVGRAAVDDEEREVGALRASCSAAPSARLSCGRGRVKDTCIIPSPVVSP
jgi:hypothetical protein